MRISEAGGYPTFNHIRTYRISVGAGDTVDFTSSLPSSNTYFIGGSMINQREFVISTEPSDTVATAGYAASSGNYNFFPKPVLVKTLKLYNATSDTAAFYFILGWN